MGRKIVNALGFKNWLGKGVVLLVGQRRPRNLYRKTLFREMLLSKKQLVCDCCVRKW